jgi:hypothetical protein
MLNPPDLGVIGGPITETPPTLSKDAWLAFLSENIFPKSTEVVAVWGDCGLGKGLELVSDVVGVVEDIDQFRRLLVRIGTTSHSSSVLTSLGLNVKLFVF